MGPGERILLKYEIKLKYDTNPKQSKCGITLQNTQCDLHEKIARMFARKESQVKNITCKAFLTSFSPF